MGKKLWTIYHVITVKDDCGYIDPDYENVGIVEATDEEIKDFVEKYNKPIVYEKDGDDLLYCHKIEAKEINVIHNLNEIKPYGPYDYHGEMAEEYQLDKKFEETYGEDWKIKGTMYAKLYEQYSTELNEIHKRWSEMRNENDQTIL